MAEHSMSQERFRAMLDAYGANPQRWPDEQREAALAFLATSPQAQRWLTESAALDACLDSAPLPPVSPALAEKILAATVARRRPEVVRPLRHARAGQTARQRWTMRHYLAAAVPFAAAAAIALWWWPGTTETPQHSTATVAQIGSFQAPTDALLNASSLDVIDELPAFGCDAGDLGCWETAPPNEQSHLEMEKFV